MNAIRFKAILSVCTFAACLAISNSSQAQCLKGDINLDGAVNMADWLPMAALIFSGEFLCEADNGDGQIDLMDVAGLQMRLLDQQNAAFTDTSTDGNGAGDFFWSTAHLNQGAVNGPLDLALAPGESVTLYLYYSTSGPSNSEIKSGYSINVATSQNGVVEFTEAETFNPLNITGFRWDYPRDATLDGEDGVGVVAAESVQSDLIIGMTAIGPLGGAGGINEAFSALDIAYDSDAQAFLCGRIQIEAVAPGRILLAAGPNDLGVVDEFELLQSVFNRVSISVSGGVLLGDVSLDGRVDFGDISHFINRLASDEYQAEADCNEDGLVNFFDIPFFISALAGNLN